MKGAYSETSYVSYKRRKKKKYCRMNMRVFILTYRMLELFPLHTRHHKWFIVSVNWNSPWVQISNDLNYTDTCSSVFLDHVYFWFLFHCTFQCNAFNSHIICGPCAYVCICVWVYESCSNSIAMHCAGWWWWSLPPASRMYAVSYSIWINSILWLLKKCSWPCQIWI